jgi:VanZ family protein
MKKLLSFVAMHWIAITLATLFGITFLSLWPLRQLPEELGSDKTHHLIAYALLMLPVALRKPERWVVFGFFFIAYGGAIELLQPYVNRHGHWLDFLANVAGVALGVIVATLLSRLYSSAGLRHSK